MMSLSANTLFHFTKKLEYLIGILAEGFAPRYCLEEASFQLPKNLRNPSLAPEEMRLGIPMTCFCDIRLTQTKYHASHYGSFIIGMSKEWGMANRITPLSYFHENSVPTLLYGEVSAIIQKLGRDLTGLTNEQLGMGMQGIGPLGKVGNSITGVLGMLMAMSCFYKPIFGNEIRNNKLTKVYYYDEREWRYIPPVGTGERSAPPLIFPDQFRDENFRQEQQEIIKAKFSLKFKEDDIKYIILPSSDLLIPFKEALRESSSKLNYDLISPKIRFYTEITEDQ